MNRMSIPFLTTCLLAAASAVSAAQAPGTAGPSSGSTPPAPVSQPTLGAGSPGGNIANTAQVPIEETILANNDLNKDGIIIKAEATKVGAGLIRQWDMYDLNKDDKVDKLEIAKAIAAYRSASTAPSGSDRPTTSPPSAPAVTTPSPSKPANAKAPLTDPSNNK
jgi:hypothetical protein